MNKEPTMQDILPASHCVRGVLAEGGDVKRTLAGVECACCGADIKPLALRILTVAGAHCSRDCAEVPS